MADYQTRIGHIHLKVRDIERSISFYTRYLNLQLIERVEDRFAFMSGGEAHQEVALYHRGGDAPLPHPQSVGLYHLAFDVASVQEFAWAYRHLIGDGIPVALVDHGVNWSLYFDDPDGIGLEICVDRRSAAQGRPLWQGQDRELTHEQVLAVLA